MTRIYTWPTWKNNKIKTILIYFYKKMQCSDRHYVLSNDIRK